MLVTSQITADLTQKELMQYVYATQDDSNTRAIEATLTANGNPWNVPNGVIGAVSFKKPDKTAGIYDTLPDGVTKAVTFEGNKATAVLAPQVLTVAGDVDLSIALYDESLNKLGTFPITLRVQKNPAAGQSISNNYYYLSTLAAVNEVIGNLADLKTTTKDNLVAAINEIVNTGGGTISEEQIQEAVSEYFKNNPASTVEVDATLQIEGMAADAKATGEALATIASKANAIFYVVGDSTSTATAWTGSHPDIVEYYDGLTVAFKTPNAGPGGGTLSLNINQLGAKMIYLNNSVTGMVNAYPKGSVILLIYVSGAWHASTVDTKNTTSTGTKNGTKMYIVGGQYPSAWTTTYTNSNCYIGADNCLYSNGEKVAVGTIPTKLSELENDLGLEGGDIPSSAVTSVNGKTGAVLLTAADVGALPNTTEIPDAYTHPETHPAAMITGLATVATSGKYSDLSGKPTIPSTLPNPNALTINGQSYDGSTAVNVEISTDDVPDYVRAEADRVAALVQSRQNANTYTLLLGSDIHARLGLVSGSYNSNQMLESTLHAAQGMKIIRDRVHVDACGLLGDFIWGEGETTAQVLEMHRIIHEYFAPAFAGLPQYWAKGNHDMAEGNLTNAQVFTNIGKYNSGATFDGGNRERGYCYRDVEEFKVRFVLMNTSETLSAEAVGTAQNNWLNTVLNVESGWKVIILSHIPIDWWGTSATVYKTIAAYASNILCNIHGHLHNYKTGMIGDTSIPRLCIPNIDFYRGNTYAGTEGFGEDTTYTKKAGTAKDTAFGAITIDFSANKLYADYYGEPIETVIDLNTGESSGGDNSGSGDDSGSTNYTNVLTTAVDASGNTYNNGSGYQTNLRLNSSGAEDPYAGMCCTGFIAATKNDVVRIKNATISGTNTPRIWTYKSDRSTAQNTIDLSTVTPDANGVYTVELINISSNETSYFRITCGVINDTTIITINEEIN